MHNNLISIVEGNINPNKKLNIINIAPVIPKCILFTILLFHQLEFKTPPNLLFEYHDMIH